MERGFGIPRAGRVHVLPPRVSRPAAEENAGVAAAWNGAPLGGSAKSLGLVREVDSESTATVTRGTPSKAEWNDGSDTLDRKDKPAPALSATEQDDEEDGDGPATVLKGQRKIVMADLEAPSPSTDDDDLNETKRADDADAANDADDPETSVGVKKVATPAPMPSPVLTAKATPVNVEPAEPTPQPESGQTRVAPIVVPPTAVAPPVMGPNTPPQAWVPPSVPPVATPSVGIRAKVLALPPHKLALVVSMTLMTAALMFVFVRSRTAAPAPQAAAPQFPPPVEVLPPAAMQLPPPTLVLPAPTYIAPAQPQPTVATKAPPAPVRPRPPTRATSRSIPVHREQ